jgi:1,4-alpha-glucan branching enzyme
MRDPTRILIISGQYPPQIGGGGSHVAYLVEELSRVQGVEVHLLTSRTPNKPVEKKIPGKNLFIHRAHFYELGGLHHEEAINKGLELCREVNPDLIHGQHFSGSLVGLHLSCAFNKPLIVTLHKTPMLNFDETKIRRDADYSYMNLLCSLDSVNSFVAGSNIFKSELVNLHVPESKIRLIKHGVRPRLLQRLSGGAKKVKFVLETLNLTVNNTLIVCPSRLDPERKGLDVFVAAGALLSQQLEEREFVFLITAEPKNQEERNYVQRLRMIAIEKGLRGRLEFKSFDFDHIPALYRLASACVLPSIREGLGLALLEAMAVRTPVVGSNTVGINEVIEKTEKEGLIFEAEDSGDLATQLKRLFREPSLVDTLRKEGLRKVKTEFNARRMAEEHLYLYLEKAKGQAQT